MSAFVALFASGVYRRRGLSKASESGVWRLAFDRLVRLVRFIAGEDRPEVFDAAEQNNNDGPHPTCGEEREQPNHYGTYKTVHSLKGSTDAHMVRLATPT